MANVSVLCNRSCTKRASCRSLPLCPLFDPKLKATEHRWTLHYYSYIVPILWAIILNFHRACIRIYGLGHTFIILLYLTGMHVAHSDCITAHFIVAACVVWLQQRNAVYRALFLKTIFLGLYSSLFVVIVSSHSTTMAMGVKTDGCLTVSICSWNWVSQSHYIFISIQDADGNIHSIYQLMLA